jgi:glucose-1-phosphatase
MLKIPSPTETGLKILAFDQGGIYIGVDYNATLESFKKLGVKNAETLYTQAEQTPTIDTFERGKCSKDSFYQYLRETLQDLNPNTSNDNLYTAWNAMLTGVIPGILEFIKQLRSLGYITIVVSNADIIHHEGVVKQLTESKVKNLFDNESFAKTYISYQFGFNKPSVAMFNAVAKDLQKNFPKENIQPSEILFIDDSKKHVDGRNNNEGAKNAGWRGLLVKPNQSVANFSKVIIAELAAAKKELNESQMQSVCSMLK